MKQQVIQLVTGLQNNDPLARFKAINLLAIVIGFMFCCLVNVVPNFNEVYAYPILFVVVVSLGLIHGSLDYDVEATHEPKTNRVSFSVKYTLQMAVIAGVWIIAPSIALGLFFLFTAWHFGETDFSLFKITFKPAMVLIYGLGLTGWLLGNHLTERILYIDRLDLFPKQTLLNPTIMENATIAIVCISFVLIAIAVISSGLYKKPMAVLSLAILLAITWYLPLLLAFTFYFGFWHSMHTINLIMNDIKVGVKTLVIKAIPYLMVSILCTAVLIATLGYLKLNAEVILFIFISSVTLPHASIMHHMLRRSREAVQLQWF